MLHFVRIILPLDPHANPETDKFPTGYIKKAQWEHTPFPPSTEVELINGLNRSFEQGEFDPCVLHMHARCVA